MELRQDVVNSLAMKHGLIADAIQNPRSGNRRVFLTRFEPANRYCQAILTVRNGELLCHTCLYQERSFINVEEIKVDDVESAVEYAVSRFDSYIEQLIDQSKPVGPRP